MLLLLDNYDSFTYNIDQLFSDIGAQVEVVRSDKISIDGIRANGYRGIIISPGPGIPQDAGIRPSARSSADASSVREKSSTARHPPSVTPARGSTAIFRIPQRSPVTTPSSSRARTCPMCWT